MKTRTRIALAGSCGLAALIIALHEPLLFFATARKATPEEVEALLGPPHHLLSPTGWHATPRWASGSVHRWKDERPVGTWTGYFRTEIAEGWVRARFDLRGEPIGGVTFFTVEGRIRDQWEENGPGRRAPPWLWGERDLTAREMPSRASVPSSPSTPDGTPVTNP